MAKKPQKSLQAFGKEYSLPSPSYEATVSSAPKGSWKYREEKARSTFARKGEGTMLAGNRVPGMKPIGGGVEVGLNAMTIMTMQSDPKLKAARNKKASKKK